MHQLYFFCIALFSKESAREGNNSVNIKQRNNNSTTAIIIIEEVREQEEEKLF